MPTTCKLLQTILLYRFNYRLETSFAILTLKLIGFQFRGYAPDTFTVIWNINKYDELELSLR